MKSYKLAPIAGVLLLAIISSGCNKLKARDQLNKGVNAYRNAQFQSAIEHFKIAVSLDPSLVNARLYLAEAYLNQYIPGGDSPDNVAIAKNAISAFENVLQLDSKNATALASIAQVYYEMKDFDKAKDYQRKRIEVEPNNPEPYYWIGVIDWAIVYPKRMGMRRDLNLVTPKDPLKPDTLPPLPEKQRAKLQQTNGQVVDEGVDALKKDIELKPNDADAYAYLNLLYREKADIEAQESARLQDVKTANEFVQKSLNIRKQNGAKEAGTGGAG